MHDLRPGHTLSDEPFMFKSFLFTDWAVCNIPLSTLRATTTKNANAFRKMRNTFTPRREKEQPQHFMRNATIRQLDTVAIKGEIWNFQRYFKSRACFAFMMLGSFERKKRVWGGGLREGVTG